MKWATVAGVEPLQILMDGDTAPLPFAPDSLIAVDPLTEGDRVLCEILGRRLVILGRSDGALSVGISLLATVQYESSDTFDPADFPTARRLHVICDSGGRAGYGAQTTSGSQVSGGPGGHGGTRAESWIDIADVTAPVSVTVGAGGTGVSGGSGNAGGTSSFGAFVIATAPGTTNGRAAAAVPTEWTNSPPATTGSVGDNIYPGAPGQSYYAAAATSAAIPPLGGSGAGGGAGSLGRLQGDGYDATGVSGGGGGTHNGPSQSARIGGAGGPGRVTVEVWG